MTPPAKRIKNPEGRLLPRHVVWRRQYNLDRYAQHLSQTELNRRIRDIVLNQLHLNEDAKIDLGRISPENAIWMEKWTHVLEEMQLRYGPFPNGFTPEILHSEPFPNFASELAEKAARQLSSKELREGRVLIKYGKREHMTQLYETGSLRIQPASYFAKTDHNGAVKDDELKREFSLALSRQHIVKVVKNPQDVPEAIPELTPVKIQFHTDYWLYCLTNSIEPRLFVDFDADACVIIRDRARFAQMLRHASIQLGAEMQSRQVLYLDPILPETGKIFVPFVKHFGYTYQKEFRFCWVPRTRVEKLEYLDITLDSLAEFSEFIGL
jgi:hypothetical protein